MGPATRRRSTSRPSADWPQPAFRSNSRPSFRRWGCIMILLALALAAQGQWTGPRTVEYRGPGNFCGGGSRVALGGGERALVLPQDTGGQGVRLVLSGGEVNIHSGVRPQSGPV